MINHSDAFSEALKAADEGQLAIDVLETETDIVIRTAIAGVRPEDIDIHVTPDLVTIRGTRKAEQQFKGATVHYNEVFWGTFSRSVILPSHVQPSGAEAAIAHGVLTLTIPKVHGEMRVNVRTA